MIIERTSQISGKTNAIDIPISPDAFIVGYTKYLEGTHIQDAFPSLSKEYREFILTGITPEEWIEMFGTGEEEE